MTWFCAALATFDRCWVDGEAAERFWFEVFTQQALTAAVSTVRGTAAAKRACRFIIYTDTALTTHLTQSLAPLYPPFFHPKVVLMFPLIFPVLHELPEKSTPLSNRILLFRVAAL